MPLRFLMALILLGPYCFSQSTDYNASSIDPSLTQNAHAVVRYDGMDVQITGLKDMEINLKRVVTVLDKTGGKYAVARVGYNKALKVKDVQALIYNAQGEEIEKKKQKDFIDVSAVDGGTLYSDSRVLFLSYTPISYPYTVEFTYQIQTSNTGFIPSWYFMDGFQVSTENSSYSITYPENVTRPMIKEKNLEGFPIEKEERPGFVSYKGHGLTAIKDEDLSPGVDKVLPHLMVANVHFYYEGFEGTIDQWDAAGKWIYDNLLQGQDQLSEATKTKMRNLVKDAPNDLEKAKLIYQYVQENTRYISVQVGIGGLQPISASEVDRLKYGDCKGLSNYTHALLEAVGVNSYYTHVESGSAQVGFETDFASLSQGDHVILAIPYKGKIYWVDCTSQTIPFGFIGDFTDARQVLMVTPEGGKLATTTAYENEVNYQKTEASLKLNDVGDLQGDVAVETQGIQYDHHYQLQSLQNQEVERYYKNNWSYLSTMDLESYSFKNNKDSVSFTETVTMGVRGYASHLDGGLLIQPNALDRSEYVPKRYRDRKLPFQISRGYMDEDHFTLELPDGYTLENVPEPVSLENKYGSYHSEVALVDGKLQYSRKLLIKKGYYPSTEYEAYRKFRREVTKMDASKIMLSKNQ